MHLSRFILLFALITIALLSCDEDESFNSDPDFRLSFSTDTVTFDTLFTGFGSTTKQLKIYNQSGGRINISRMFLDDLNSPYRMNINGIQSNDLRDVEIAANDSLYVFIEVDLEAKDEDAPRLLENQLAFETNGQLQKVILETYAQDVYVIDGDIQNSQNWTGNRPYLIMKPVWLSEGTTLNLEEGTRVYFRKDAGLHIKGELNVNGSFEKPVYFGSTRLEKLYDNVPGQWDGIYFYEESTNNSLSHFILEDGVNGLIFDKETYDNSLIKIDYGIIRNFTQNGISVSNSNLIAHDILLSNCGEECINLEGQGSFAIYHSTLYNTWFFSPRSGSVINYAGDEDSGLQVVNCIIWGSKTDELELIKTDNVMVENSLIKLSNSKQGDYASVFADCIFNEDPLFADLEEFDFILSAESPAINKGNKDVGNQYFMDLSGNPRNIDEAPDMGTYEYVSDEL